MRVGGASDIERCDAEAGGAMKGFPSSGRCRLADEDSRCEDPAPLVLIFARFLGDGWPRSSSSVDVVGETERLPFEDDTADEDGIPTTFVVWSNAACNRLTRAVDLAGS